MTFAAAVPAIISGGIPFLALGSWMLCIGWFGFNVMSAQAIEGISGLVAVNSLMAMAGGVIFALIISKNDPGFIHNGALAGLVVICAGSDKVHPVAAFIIGGVAAVIFIKAFTYEQEILRIDDVLGVWPLHGLCGTWGGVACGIFGVKAFGGVGGVSMIAQVIGTVTGVVFALISGIVIYKVMDLLFGIRLSEEEEMMGADLAVHHIEAYPEETARF